MKATRGGDAAKVGGMITTTEAGALKRQLECDILKLLKAYHAATGLVPESVEVEKTNLDCRPGRKIVQVGVTVTTTETGALKRQLERDILKLLKTYHAATGLVPESVEVEKTNLDYVGRPARKIVQVGVTVRFEL